MSIIISTSQEISQSPLNLSKSKQLYSFPKELRFRNNSQKPWDQIYDLPPMREKRAVSFGHSKKVDFVGSSRSPGPLRYHIPRDFEDQKDKSRGFSLGLGRNNVSFGSMFNDNSFRIPGPGQYVAPSQMSNIKYSIRARTPVNEDKHTNKDVTLPGPGAYPNPLGFNVAGKYPNSSFSNIRMGVINPVGAGVGRTRILSHSSVKLKSLPGPGEYPSAASITATGRHSVHKFRSSGACTFAVSTRTEMNSKDLLMNPGPGSYRLPSEFGYYENKKKATIELLPLKKD